MNDDNRVAWNFSFSPRFRLADRKQLPASSGIYVVTGADRVLYVGIASSFRSRWSRHHKAAAIEAIAPDAWIYCVEMTPFEAQGLERHYILMLAPDLNSSPGYMQVVVETIAEYAVRHVEEYKRLAAFYGDPLHMLDVPALATAANAPAIPEAA
jgi:hypothetical protein